MRSYSQLIVTKKGKLIFSNLTDYQLSSTISKYMQRYKGSVYT